MFPPSLISFFKDKLCYLNVLISEKKIMQLYKNTNTKNTNLTVRCIEIWSLLLVAKEELGFCRIAFYGLSFNKDMPEANRNSGD